MKNKNHANFLFHTIDKTTSNYVDVSPFQLVALALGSQSLCVRKTEQGVGRDGSEKKENLIFLKANSAP